jgi:hypothetical protein
VRRLLYVAYFLEVGLLLVLVPWSGFWDQNYFVAGTPMLQTLLGNHFVRGGVSGLGLVNLCAGASELAGILSFRRAGMSRPGSIMRTDGHHPD